jgi:hypothetical protein
VESFVLLSLFGEGEPLAVGVDKIYNSKSIIYNYRSNTPPRQASLPPLKRGI